MEHHSDNFHLHFPVQIELADLDKIMEYSHTLISQINELLKTFWIVLITISIDTSMII